MLILRQRQFTGHDERRRKKGATHRGHQGVAKLSTPLIFPIAQMEINCRCTKACHKCSSSLYPILLNEQGSYLYNSKIYARYSYLLPSIRSIYSFSISLSISRLMSTGCIVPRVLVALIVSAISSWCPIVLRLFMMRTTAACVS